MFVYKIISPLTYKLSFFYTQMLVTPIRRHFDIIHSRLKNAQLQNIFYDSNNNLEVRFYIPPDTKQVILETLFPANLLD